ncbi:hypothetical protein AN7887.2 [Aspergillus nidulans FGSC A4]|uniref:Uncharacterized protein n=1 Tax=Emericella nidulans (strain FGSC A4 / ATCC 38163 / CBS 112.46 / NRRL 194 / M139) TaxID=227321 RepID=Q5AUZ3_EMENI|nr:hypothetical protein [Aspergillus nidulans FGSC A4]EAA59541.1 hypothetical protein AN7887.2 [Aspergillus nidulans FGSC A4]CBF73459.1 TPA: conserved hypothetical protein [Aspergillus nidulans FGSC A4]|eukprot:XP_681156.1 hypothetical protein AN7887.2 [Aspergillus nidulans FGSC A4]
MRLSSILKCAVLAQFAVSSALPSKSQGNDYTRLSSAFGCQLYGFPDNEDGSANNAIPPNLRSGSRFKYCPAGGAQLTSPSLRDARGTRGSLDAVHYPGDAGDEGDWVHFDDFMGQGIAFIKNNNMQDGLELDLWNGPDSTLFWNTDYSQYLETWTRMCKRFNLTNTGAVP